MSKSLNKAMLIGNVGGDPEVTTTKGGHTLAKFSLATNRTFEDRTGQKQEKVEWHRCTVWGKLADVVGQWVHKGDRLYVEGRIEYSQSEGDDGVTRYWTDLVVGEMVMLGSSGQGGQQSGGTPTPRPAATPPADLSQPDGSDLPF